MIEIVQKEIEDINNNISILPTKTKKNITEYNNYIDSQIKEFKDKNVSVKGEIVRRYNEYLSFSSSGGDIEDEKGIDLDNVYAKSEYATSMDKMNLKYYFFELHRFYQKDLGKINQIIHEIINAFKMCGIKLTPEDFKYTEVVNEYMNNLFSEKENIEKIFDELYWANPNIIHQIELNFRYLYFKYESKIDKFYQKEYKQFDLNKYMKVYFDNKEKVEDSKHSNIKYLCNLFLKNILSISDVSEKNINATKDSLGITDINSNYDILNQLITSLKEYKNYMDFEYIITDIKKLFETKAEYKSIYATKYKEIKKKEKEIFKYTNKLNKKGLFAPKNIGEIKLLRNNAIEEVYNLYKELDDLSIKDSIFKYVNADTSYSEILKLSVLDFSYFANIYLVNNEEASIDEIVENRNKLNEFIFENSINIINNVRLTEEKNLSQIIYDKYKMFNVNINEEKLTIEEIENYIKLINNLIVSADLINNKINISNLEFILNVNKLGIK